MTALDASEELHADAFEPVGADRSQDLGPPGVEIVLEEFIAEIPHGELRGVTKSPQTVARANGADRRDELMTLAAQAKELRARRRAIPRLVEPIPFADQQLVGADDEIAGMAAGDAHRLRLGEGIGTVGGGAPLGLEGGLDLALVDGGELDAEGEAGVAHQLGPHRAGRGEDQRQGPVRGRGAHSSVPCRRASSLRIDAAVSSIERRDTSITGQWFCAKRRRACCTSLRTASISV